MAGVKHATAVIAADDGISEVGSDEWNADHVVTDLAVGGKLGLTGAPVTATTTGNIVDLAITNSVYRWNGASAASLLGIAGGYDGRIVVIRSIAAGQTLTLKSENLTETTAANRITLPGSGADLPVFVGYDLLLQYDGTTSRWRVMASQPILGGTSLAVGTVATGTSPASARADHVHPTGATTPVTQAFSDVAAIGTGPHAAMENHVHGMPAAEVLFDVASASQQVSGASDQYLTASKITVPSTKLKVGSIVKWRIYIDKTGAGVATPIVKVWVGTNGSTGDTAVATFTFLAQTGVIDTGYIDMTLTCRGPLSSSGIFQIGVIFQHNLTTTGLANAAQPQIKQVTSGVFDVTTAGLFIGLSINPGASGVWNCQQIESETVNL